MTTATEDRPAATQAGRKPARSRRKAVAPVDRTTAYARGVVDRSIIAGPHVRAACARHLRDLDEGPARGLIWNLDAANEAIAFFEEVLCLNGGDFEGRAFVLDGWQAFIVGSINGWQVEDPVKGRIRRFRVAYVETGKGSGKSPLAAGVGLKGLTAEGEARAECYAAATKKDQAMILFRDAVAMVDQSPELAARLTKSGVGEQTWNLAYRATGSYFKPISADEGASGPRPHIGLVDEYHEHKTDLVYQLLRAGTKSRRQALIFIITNSGAGLTSPCGLMHDYAAAIAGGVKHDDAFFSYVCALDEGDDPINDESCWPKANPSLQFVGLPGYQYLREQVTEARGMPSKEAIVRRLNFCQWTSALSPWLSAHVWDPCRQAYDAVDLRGRRAFGGLDLSSTTDLTAFVLLVEPAEPGEPWSILSWCWLPEGGHDFTLQHRSARDRVDYVTWAKQGHLLTTPGAAISRRHVLQQVAQICADFDVRHVAADRWRLEDFKQTAEDDGISLPELIPFGQGYQSMSPAIDVFEAAILNREVRHNGHPVLTWCAANAVTTSDAAGNRKLDKAKATGRMDLIVAAVMAYAGAAAQVDKLPVIGNDYELMTV